MRNVRKFDAWISQRLTRQNENQCVRACVFLPARHHFARQQHRSFLSLIVTGVEKWCLYANMKQKKEWANKGGQVKSQTKAELHLRSVLLLVWWRANGVIQYKLLGQNDASVEKIYH